MIIVKVFVHVPNYFSIEIEQLFLLFAEKFIELLFWIEKLNLFLYNLLFNLYFPFVA